MRIIKGIFTLLIWISFSANLIWRESIVKKNKTYKNSHAIIAQENAIFYILVLALILRMILLIAYGNNMYLFSDDVNYINSAIELIKSGHITYESKSYITLCGMPGMFLFMGGLFKIFNYTAEGLFLCRMVFIALSTLTVYGVYLCSKIIFKNIAAANIAALMLAISVSDIALSNIFLIETPAVFILVYMTYFALKFCGNRSDKNFVLMLLFYLLGILFKPTFGIYIVAFLPLMIKNKMPLKEMILRGGCALIVICMFLSPWWIRNYKLVGEFVPLSGNQGDTLLLGTFQGIGYPPGDKNEIFSKAKEEGQKMVTKYGVWHPYLEFKLKGDMAKERIQEWKTNNPKDFYLSNMIYKPGWALKDAYYPTEIFNIDLKHLRIIHLFYWAMFLIGFYFMYTYGKKDKDLLIKSICVISGGILLVMVSSFYYAFERYAVSFMFVLKMISAFSIYNLAVNLKKRLISNKR